MKITKLELQANNPNKYNLFIDNKYAFPITINFYIEHSSLIKINEEITQEEIDKIKELSQPEEAFSQLCYLLKFGDRSAKEMTQKLKLKKFNENAITWAIEKAINIGLMNDETFCLNKINMFKARKYSRKQMLQKFYEKGIDRTFAEKIIDENCDYDFFYDIALEKGNKKLNTIKERDFYKRKNKLYQYLAGLGFQYDIISDVLEKILTNINDEE